MKIYEKDNKSALDTVIAIKKIDLLELIEKLNELSKNFSAYCTSDNSYSVICDREEEGK